MSRENNVERSLPSSHYSTPSISSQGTLRLFLSGRCWRVSEWPVTQTFHAGILKTIFPTAYLQGKEKSKVPLGQILPFCPAGGSQSGRGEQVKGALSLPCAGCRNQASTSPTSALVTPRGPCCHLPAQPSTQGKPQVVARWPGPARTATRVAPAAGAGDWEPRLGTSLAAASAPTTPK